MVPGAPAAVIMPTCRFIATQIDGAPGLIDFHIEPKDLD
jgi:hypothetical protein